MYVHVYKSVKFSERISTMYMQLNPCDLETIGSVLIREVSRYTNMVLGEEESVLIREVSLF